ETERHYLGPSMGWNRLHSAASNTASGALYSDQLYRSHRLRPHRGPVSQKRIAATKDNGRRDHRLRAEQRLGLDDRRNRHSLSSVFELGFSTDRSDRPGFDIVGHLLAGDVSAG